MLARGSSDYFDLQHHGCTPVSCGLLLPPDLTLEDWAAVGRALGRQQHAWQWRVGDWWNHPRHAYGDRSAIVEAEDWTGPAYSTCANAGSVCAKFETSRRRELLSWSHHVEVAHRPLPLAFVDELLDWCEETRPATGKPRSVHALREEIKQRLEQMVARSVSPIEAPSRSVALQIVRPEEPESQDYALVPLPAAPHHEPEVQQRGAVVEIASFKAFLRYAEKQLRPDATAAALVAAIGETKQLVARLEKRLRQAGGGAEFDNVVNLR
jgi:hypothetical protein